MKRRKKLLLWLLAAAVVLAIVVGVGTVWSDGGSALDDEQLIAVKRGNLTLSVVATGSIVPLTQVELKAKAAGIVERILVQEGDPVKSGDVLLELDRELLAAQVRESEANLMAVNARLEETRADAASAGTLKQKMQLDLRNLADNLAFREKQVQRYQQMSREEIVALSELDQIERDRQDVFLQQEALKSELLMQDARILAAQKGVSRVEAEVIQAQAALDRALENLRYARISSPIAGTVLKKHVEEGDAVSSILQLGSQATLLMTLGDMSQLFVEGRVDESDIGQVYLGQPARVRVDAFRGESFDGKVVRIAPMGEEEDNVIAFEVRVSLVDQQKKLKVGMSANAEIIREERKDVLIIPEAAIIYGDAQQSLVEVPDPEQPNGTKRVPIEIGISDGTSTQVVSGLREGDRLISQAR